MIPPLRLEQCIGRGFAVWDEEHEIARKYVMVPRLPEGAWESRNPIAELFEMMNGKEDTE